MYNELDDPRANQKIRASLIVNEDTMRIIRHTSASLMGDTLRILIKQLNPAYYHTYSIHVVEDKYWIDYNFLTSGVDVTRKIVNIDSKLKLSTLDFTPGKEIRGYTEFVGRCTKGCWEDTLSIKGNFKCVIE